MRPAEARDLPAVAALIAAGFEARIAATDCDEAGRATFRSLATAVAIARRLARGAVARVAVERGPDGGEAVAGYGELRGRGHVPDGVDHLAFLFTAPDRLGRGVGRLLLAELVTTARARRPGLDSLTVHASSYAVPVYERLGFRVAGERATRDGIAFTPMRLDLPPTSEG